MVGLQKRYGDCCCESIQVVVRALIALAHALCVTGYNEKRDGPPGTKTFTKLVTKILLDEKQEQERKRLEELNLQQQGLRSQYAVSSHGAMIDRQLTLS